MNRIIKIINIEIFELCKLNLETGETFFYIDKSEVGKRLDGFYFKDYKTFFVLFETSKGPMMYYKGREYVLHKGLHITLRIDGEAREFIIEEYNIKINYLESMYLGLDAWSTDEEVDLFYQIAHHYQDDEFYKKYTIK